MDEPSLGADALAALQDVLGESALGGDLAEFAALLSARRAAADSSDDDDSEDGDSDAGVGDESGRRPGESHADYYRRLYPERFAEEDAGAQAAAEAPVTEPLALVTIEDEYVQNLVLKAFERRPHWRVCTTVPSAAEGADMDESLEPYDLHWGEYEHLEFFSPRFAAGNFTASCYYNRKGLIRKGHLAHIMEKWRTKNPDRAPLAPKSYILTLESGKENDLDASFPAAMARSGFPGFNEDQGAGEARDVVDDGNVWILKPSVTNQAQGICLVRSEAQLREAIERADEMQRAGDFVLQQYLEPLLLDGRKFHLRVFMLLVGNLTAYVSPDFLAIFSLEQYAGASLDETRAHLTNISHQQVLSLEDQHRCMRLFAETAPDMVAAGVAADEAEATERIADVQQRVFDIIADMVAAASSELTFQTRKNCFELFGLDFMVDPDWGVWLLEANAEPDLSKAGDRLQGVIDDILQDTLKLVVDHNPRFPSTAEAAAAPVRLREVYQRAGRAW